VKLTTLGEITLTLHIKRIGPGAEHLLLHTASHFLRIQHTTRPAPFEPLVLVKHQFPSLNVPFGSTGLIVDGDLDTRLAHTLLLGDHLDLLLTLGGIGGVPDIPEVVPVVLLTAHGRLRFGQDEGGDILLGGINRQVIVVGNLILDKGEVPPSLALIHAAVSFHDVADVEAGLVFLGRFLGVLELVVLDLATKKALLLLFLLDDVDGPGSKPVVHAVGGLVQLVLLGDPDAVLLGGDLLLGLVLTLGVVVVLVHGHLLDDLLDDLLLDLFSNLRLRHSGSQDSSSWVSLSYFFFKKLGKGIIVQY